MFKNNLKIAWRHLLKEKYISLINFVGLVVGMTAVLFIWQYVAYEKSYDKLHEKGENIYRVRTDRVDNGVAFMQFAAGAACAGPVIANNFPEVENYVKLTASGDAIYTRKDNKDVSFQPERVYFAMPSFFEMFSFPLVKGNPETCLNEPFSACITESVAKKMFGDVDPIGKTLNRNNDTDYKITGILKDAPQNSHIKFDILLSYITYSDVFNEGGQSETNPYWDGFLTYLQLKPGTDWQAMESRIPAIMESTYDKEASESVVFYLQPFEDIHLKSNFLFETEAPGDGNAVNFLLLIGSLVLLIAWFNYINLSTARSEIRAKEVGVRKVVGSGRASLIRQFMTEAALLNLAAIVSAFLLAQLLSPWFVNLIERPIPMSIFSNGKLLLIILGVFALGTLLTGFYPAVLLSSFKPITVLNGGATKSRNNRGNWMRKGLVVFQFVASIALIASTIIIYNQLDYMKDKKLGVDIEQTLVIKRPIVIDSTFSDKAKTFRKQLERMAVVNQVSNSTAVPGQPFGWTAGVTKIGDDEEPYGLHAMAADFNYTEMYDLDFVAGRALSDKMGSDDRSCVINESAVKVFDFATPEEALGLEIDFWGDPMTVVGVVKDFHQESPKSIVEPMILRGFAQRFVPEYFSLKLNTKEIGHTMSDIEGVWKSMFTDNPLDFFFLDDHYDKQYASEQLFGKIFSLFSGLAILVSCLGLFALIAFVAERKKKEIGIRKVLGASVYNIVGLLSKDFIQLVIVALVLAIPLSWYFMNGWLDGFAERIDLQWWYFALAAVVAITIALATMSFQSIRAAMNSPSESLRSE